MLERSLQKKGQYAAPLDAVMREYLDLGNT